MYGGAAAALQPKAWQSFLEALAPAERRDPLPAYYRRLTSTDTAVRDAAVRMQGHTWRADRIRAVYEAGFKALWLSS